MIAHAFSGDKGRGPQPSSAPIGRIQQRMLDTRRKQTYTSKATKAKQRVEANREKDMQKLAQYWGDWHTAPSKWDVMREQASKGLAQWDNESTEKPEETTN